MYRTLSILFLSISFSFGQDYFIVNDGVKTEESDKEVTQQWSEQHLELGINSMTEISKSGEQIQHFRY